jgi:integrase
LDRACSNLATAASLPAQGFPTFPNDERNYRGGELCALKVEDLNLDHRVLAARRSVWKGELQTIKSKKGVRTFAISSQLREDLKSYLVAHWKNNPKKLLFCTSRRKPV